MNIIRKRWLFALVIAAAIVAFGVEESPNASDQAASEPAVEAKPAS